MNVWVLTISCDDRPGIVHAVSGGCVAARGNIVESSQFSSTDTGRFFMRLEVETEVGREEFAAAMSPIVESFDATW
ncbi:MAG TPA: ACT domain-containing protein, partial [Propionibacteriaceae bacterium]|nr:ACT domain-containing protein [Propionibacteriaceae bacterium]